MIDQNLIYIYDSKSEHNGPYKDFNKAVLEEIKDQKGIALKFSKVARGIYKIASTQDEKQVTAIVTFEKKKKEIKILHE